MSDRLRTWEHPRPDEIGATAEAFLARLDGPTVLRLAGRDRARTRAVATLLHGNEPSGLRALHAWLASGIEPAVDLVCCIANVEAARDAHRMRPGRRDLNRCFLPPFDGEEGLLAQEILTTLHAAGAEALIDLHNTTGHTPPYAVATRVDPARLHLTWMFASRLVHSELRLGALTEVLADELPAVTIECGRAGDVAADAVALAGLDRYLSAETLDWNAPPPPVRIFEHQLRVTLHPGCTVAFGSRAVPGATVTLAPDVDRYNFTRIPAGAALGWADPHAPLPIAARGDDGGDVAEELFRMADGVLETRADLVPIMVTTDPRIAAEDCLFYVVRARDAPTVETAP